MLNSRALALAATAVVASLALAGCSGAAPATQDSTPPVVSSAVPPGGQPLGQLGIEHGPFLTLPVGIRPTRTIDQPNVVTILVSTADGAKVIAHLKANLAKQGWTVTAESDDSLIFTTQGWEGAFTMSDDLAGLTLRRVS